MGRKPNIAIGGSLAVCALRDEGATVGVAPSSSPAGREGRIRRRLFGYDVASIMYPYAPTEYAGSARRRKATGNRVASARRRV